MSALRCHYIFSNIKILYSISVPFSLNSVLYNFDQYIDNLYSIKFKLLYCVVILYNFISIIFD